MRVVVRCIPRYEIGASDMRSLKMRKALERNDTVRPVVAVGRESGFVDIRTSLHYAYRWAKETGQVVEMLNGVWTVHPKDMSEHDVLEHGKRINLFHSDGSLN